MPLRAEEWLKVLPAGLWCEPAGCFIDPMRPVERALITHGHADHARPNHTNVLATKETLDIMRTRFGAAAGERLEAVAYHETKRIGDVEVTFRPAGHVLGSANIMLDYAGTRIVVSGDYKRRRDPTCPPFETVPCDIFITEATFGLPVFRHPPASSEIDKLLQSMLMFPSRTHVVGVYALGKCQRVIALIREAGYDRPIYLHGALQSLCALYERHQISLGDLRPATGEHKQVLAGEIVLAPPGAIADRWSRRLVDPVVALASGWMNIRQRARQRGVELPLIISDHADWDELNQTIDEMQAPEIWVTHGREEALVHAAEARGIKARALSLIGFEEDDSF